MFFTKYTLFVEKNEFYLEKKNYIDFFLQKMKKIYVSFEKYFFIQKIYIYSAKKNFLIIKNIFVKTSW